MTIAAAVFVLLGAAAQLRGGAPVAAPVDAGVPDPRADTDAGMSDAGQDAIRVFEVDGGASSEGLFRPRDEPMSTARPPSAELVGLPVTAVSVRLQKPDDEEVQQLERYLMDLTGTALSTALLVEAQDRLLRLGRFRSAVCRAGPAAGGAALTCSITRARTIREVEIENLPAILLESDLRKRIFLRRGEPLENRDTTGKNRIPRQRERIEDYLAREGFFGSEVKILTPRAADEGDVDVVVRIRGGAFVHVRRVDLAGPGPLSEENIKNTFGQMCLSPAGLLDGLFYGTLRCFNRERLKDTTARAEERLVELGYPEGRVRVDVVPVDATEDEELQDECGYTAKQQAAYKEAGLDVPPRCVDLKVSVAPGPHLTTEIVLTAPHGQPVPNRVDLPELGDEWLLWIHRSLIVPSARVVQTISGAWETTTIDTRNIVVDDLEESFTFDEANAVDETETELSARSVQSALGERGFPLAEVDVIREERGTDDIYAKFVVDAGPPLWITRVRFVGNDLVTDEEIREVDLAARPRAFAASGYVSQMQLEDDEVRLRDFYASRGFPEAVVESEIVRTSQHTIDVVFRIGEGERFTVAALELVGGDPELTPALLQALVHCQGGVAAQDDRDPEKPEDCAGSPFLPDELAGEEQRTLNVYAAAGYAHVDAEVDIGFSEQGTLLRISVKPKGDVEGASIKRARLGEVFIEGNVLTLRSVILRELGLNDAEYGEPLDPVEIAEGVSRLRRTGLYSRVQLDYLGLNDENTDVVHVRVRVEERPVATVDTSVGFSSERLASLRGEARHRNVLGWTLDASALLDFGLFIGRYSEASTQVRWPRIYGSDVTGTVALQAVYLDAPAGLRKLAPPSLAPVEAFPSWRDPDKRRRELGVGGTLGFDLKLGEALTTGIGYDGGLQWNNLAAEPIEPFSPRAYATLDGLTTAFDVDEITVGAITPRIAWNSVDNPFDPLRGFAVESFVRMSAPWLLAKNYFAVFGVGARGYYTFDRLTLAGATRLRWGVAEPGVVCPAYEPNCQWVLMQRDLLRLGGQRTIRGYAQDSIGPQDLPLGPNFEKLSDIAASRPGLFGVVTNLEARFTLLRNFFLGDVKPAAFIDMGVTTDDLNLPAPIPGSPDAGVYQRLVEDRRFGLSVGLGLRYVLPVGPAAIDCAVSPIHRAENGAPQAACEIAFGYIF